jgi:hypothetical protein
VEVPCWGTVRETDEELLSLLPALMLPKLRLEPASGSPVVSILGALSSVSQLHCAGRLAGAAEAPLEGGRWDLRGRTRREPSCKVCRVCP